MADIVYPNLPAGGPLGHASLPSNYDLALYRGDDFELLVTIGDANGNPINFTGHTPRAQLRRSYEDSTVSAEAVCTIEGGTSVRVSLTSAQTSLLDQEDYIWDFQVTSPQGKVRTYLTGDVRVYKEVTR